MLSGYKTYVVSAAVVLSAVAAFVTGDVDLQGAINQALLGLGLGTLRAGVASKL
jgi:hypothetical protein